MELLVLMLDSMIGGTAIYIVAVNANAHIGKPSILHMGLKDGEATIEIIGIL